MSKKHKRHKLNSYYSPYENGYVPPKPVKPEKVEVKAAEPEQAKPDYAKLLSSMALLGHIWTEMQAGRWGK